MERKTQMKNREKPKRVNKNKRKKEKEREKYFISYVQHNMVI